MGVKKLKDNELQQIFKKDLEEGDKIGGFIIKKAKGFWKCWLEFVYKRLLMELAKKGVRIRKQHPLIAIMAWKGKVLN